MKTKEYTFFIDGHEVIVPVTYKHQRGLYLRAKGDGFVASAPILAPEYKVKKFIEESLPILIKRINKRAKQEALSGEGYTYVLGERIEKEYPKAVLKKFALEVFTRYTRECESLMGIKNPYKIHIKDMSTRYGSNSLKTHSINYQLNLVHFSEEIIKSVVIHELAHEFQRNHQKKFYDIVLKYCPNYWELKKKLRKGIAK